MTYTINDLADIEDQVRRIMWRWQGRDEFEDCVQEAVIRAWKDITADEEYSDKHIMNRAVQRYKAVATSDSHHYTGYLGRCHEGRRTPAPLSPVEEKVRAYRHEYAALHDGYAPTPKQTADAVGLPKWQARNAIERVKGSEQRYSSALTRKDGDHERLDIAAYRHVAPPTTDGDVIQSAALVRAFGEPTFEEELVDRIAFDADLERLFPGDTRAHVALRWRHIDGLTVEEIGNRLYAHHKTPQPAASRYLNKLHKIWLADKEAC
ncbi:hypothetical protein ACWD2L_06085 [Streptomyces sp. NPDC002754]